MGYELVAIGSSWGGLAALERLLGDLGEAFPVPVAIAQHRTAVRQGASLQELLARHCRLEVCEAEDKQPIEPGRVYLAPPDYHLLVERGELVLSVDERVQFSRPSVDVLLESASDAYRERLVGVVLTGTNADGAQGLSVARARGALTVVQDPEDAERGEMPAAAIAAGAAQRVLPLTRIGRFLAEVCRGARAGQERPA